MKKFLLKSLNFSYFFICWWIFLSLDAHAYIDPSATTYVIQAVATVFISLGAILTVFRHKIFAFFKKNSKNGQEDEIHFKEVPEETTNDNH